MLSSHRYLIMQKFILIVDDDSEDVQFLMEALHQTNQAYDCVAVSNGEEALRFLSDTVENPEYIFLDLNMPRINGKECLIEIKNNNRFIDVPIVIYSTTSQKKEMDELYHLGANYFLTKPHSFRSLINSLAGIFSGKSKKVKHWFFYTFSKFNFGFYQHYIHYFSNYIST